MKDKLKKLLENAYAPYSNYQVASIVVMKDGTEFSGVNVENASFGATICAERVAITSAIAHGYQKKDFKSIYVMVNHEKIGTCCFLCRQVILEFFPKDATIICMNKEGIKKEFTVEDFCPYPFDEENLV